tara:strand:- start:1967 stop:2713 length:747 start_codon:yes stop_codon:yes gene_type:complete
MSNNPNIIAIIPARGGSKGVPKKNIRNIGGFPLISYSIFLGKNLKNIDRCIVSTDNDEIAQISKNYGADVPFLRPPELALDTSKDIEFFRHAIDWFDKNEGYVPEYWVQLRPTTPLREPSIVDNAISTILNNSSATSLVSIHEFAETPGKMFGMLDGYLHGLCPLDPRPEYFTLPRQEFAPTYFGNGYVDIVKSSTIINKKSCYGSKMLGFETPDTGEIDTEEDFKKVEFYLNKTKNKIFDQLSKHKL